MTIRVLYYDREDRTLLSIPTISLENAEAVTSVIRVSTKADFCTEMETHGGSLVILGESVDWPWREVVSYLDEKAPEVPRLLILDQEDASIRREALLAGVWQTVERRQTDVLESVIRLHMRHAVSVHLSATVQEALVTAERILQKNQKSIALGVLLASIAHEINNPLEGVANLLYLAKRTKQNEEYLQVSLDLAEAELSRVSEITKQMLSFHRDASRPENVSLAELLDGILLLFAAKLRQLQIKVVRQFDSQGWMVAFPGELRQALVNLIANAIDAMPNGGRLTIRVRERDGKIPRLCVSVADSGQGMPREARDRFGDLFVTTKGKSGTGLGGWVTRRIVKKYGGDLGIYSSQRSGRSGTVIRLCFPEPHARITGNTPRAKVRLRTQQRNGTLEQYGKERELRSA